MTIDSKVADALKAFRTRFSETRNELDATQEKLDPNSQAIRDSYDLFEAKIAGLEFEKSELENSYDELLTSVVATIDGYNERLGVVQTYAEQVGENITDFMNELQKELLDL